MPQSKPATPSAKKTQSKKASRRATAVEPCAAPQTDRSSTPIKITIEECLRKLIEVAARVERRLLSPGAGNLISANYRSILGCLQKSEIPQVTRLPDDVVRELYRTRPEFLSRLESLLTDEQMAMINRELQDVSQ